MTPKEQVQTISNDTDQNSAYTTIQNTDCNTNQNTDYNTIQNTDSNTIQNTDCNTIQNTDCNTNQSTACNNALAKEPDEKRVKLGKALLLPTVIFALFIAFFEYDTYSFLGLNHWGLSTLFITAGAIAYFVAVMKLLHKELKVTNIVYMTGLSLLAIATFLSNDDFMATINKYAIILLTLNLFMNGLVDDSKWGLTDHIAAWFKAIFGGLSMLDSAPKDYKAIRKSYSRESKNSEASKILIGLLLAIPLLLVILPILCSADAIFEEVLSNLIPNIKISTLISFVFITCFVLFVGYSIIRFILGDRFVISKTESTRKSALIAITIGLIISIVYGAFSIVQFVYLFGKHTLPAGYTYASYAKEGVFQLMWLSVINLILVILGIVLFEKNNLLKFILTFISACTYLMIASSSYRLWQYVNICHGLTRKRIWGIWGLVTVSICFVGVIIFIYKDTFKLYRFGLITICSTYILLALCKPDYIVAKVNVELLPGIIQSQCDTELLNRLGSDALPVMIKYDPEWPKNRGLYKDYDECVAIYGTDYAEKLHEVYWKDINLSDLRGRKAFYKQ